MVSVESRIEQVTVYASGARIRRVATLAAPLPDVVCFGGLPLGALDDTVRVEVDGPAVATAVRTRVEGPAAEVAADEDAAELRAARRRVALAEAELDRVDAALASIAQAPIVEPDPSDDPPVAWSAVVAARRTLVAVRATRELQLRDQRAAARRDLAKATELLVAITDREHRAGTARAPKLHELRKLVELELAIGELPPDAAVEIHIEYQVAAARWAPSYVARLEGEQVRFELRAVVAQDSGEDWLGVALRLSTAEPERFAALPELAAQRIGRRQDAPARAGFRAPPTGADQLYADYRLAFPPVRARDRAITQPFAGDADGAPPFAGALAQEVWDEDSSLPKDAFLTPPLGSPRPHASVLPGAPPPPPPMQLLSEQAAGAFPQLQRASARGGHGGQTARPSSVAMAMLGKPRPPAAAAAPVPRLDYAGLRMAAPSSDQAGQLIPAGSDPLASAAAQEAAVGAARLALLVLPRGCRADWVHSYDYAFASDGAIDVRADGVWHGIALTSRTATAKVGHVAVPREQADVFRVANIPNPFAGPLLPGPIDVYDRGQFLLTSEVDHTPPGATVQIGLGVDATVKIARNAEFREEAAGMLRGALRLVHAIAIDVENLSGRAIDVEIRERIPVTREGEDDIEVTLGKIEPAWERWTPEAPTANDPRLRGGYRWRLALPAGTKRTLRGGYEVKIASKHELVGGNRREP